METLLAVATGLAGPIGAFIALLLLVWGFLSGRIVPGWLYRNEVRRADEAERRAWRMATGLAEPAIRTAEKLVERPRDDPRDW